MLRGYTVNNNNNAIIKCKIFMHDSNIDIVSIVCFNNSVTNDMIIDENIEMFEFMNKYQGYNSMIMCSIWMSWIVYMSTMLHEIKCYDRDHVWI